jgi:peptidyl-prolyl cis-trans isomerase A (cyclophilin A)
LKRITHTLFSLVFVVTHLSAQKKETCVITTTLGEIYIELYPKKAPITVANFLKYVDAKLYDKSCFFRSVTLNNQPNNLVKIEVIQGGEVDSTKVFTAIPLERTSTTILHHKNLTTRSNSGSIFQT